MYMYEKYILQTKRTHDNGKLTAFGCKYYFKEFEKLAPDMADYKSARWLDMLTTRL